MKSIVYFFLIVTVSALPVRNNGVCQYGGNAACVASCAVNGYNCGYCDGTEPNEKCICEHCSNNDMSCTNGGEAACIASCKVQGRCGGHCVGIAPHETCVCSPCYNATRIVESPERNATKHYLKAQNSRSACFKAAENKNASNGCDYGMGCSDCASTCREHGYSYMCCYGDTCCCYATTGLCSVDPACPGTYCG